MPDAPNFERVQHGVIPNPVDVNLPSGAKARVKSRRSARDSEHADFVWKARIQRSGPAFERNPIAWHIHVRDLSERMHARVSSARAVHDHTLSNYFSKRTFQVVLHGVPSRLALPPAEGATVICKQKLESNH